MLVAWYPSVYAPRAREGRMTVTIGRRELLAALGGAAVAWPRAARAQQPVMPVIGFLGAATPAVASQWLAAFVQRMGELGWVDSRNVMIEVRWAEGRGERAAEIAAEFVRFKVNIIATWSTAAALAAKSATCVGLSGRHAQLFLESAHHPSPLEVQPVELGGVVPIDRARLAFAHPQIGEGAI